MVSDLSVTSTACPLAGDAISVPSAFMEAPVVIFLTAFSIVALSVSAEEVLRSKVSCMDAKQEPSFTWINTRFLESRMVRTQPHTVTMRSSGSDVRMSFINCGFMEVIVVIYTYCFK